MAENARTHKHLCFICVGNDPNFILVCSVHRTVLNSHPGFSTAFLAPFIHWLIDRELIKSLNISTSI